MGFFDAVLWLLLQLLSSKVCRKGALSCRVEPGTNTHILEMDACTAAAWCAGDALGGSRQRGPWQAGRDQFALPATEPRLWGVGRNQSENGTPSQPCAFASRRYRLAHHAAGSGQPRYLLMVMAGQPRLTSTYALNCSLLPIFTSLLFVSQLTILTHRPSLSCSNRSGSFCLAPTP